MTDIDVAVVGGGLAGLAAAGCLRRSGRAPVVFEATERVGGRQRTGRLAGEVLEEGAVFFGPQYHALGGYLAAAGLDRGLKTYDVRSIKPLPGTPTLPSTGRRLVGSRTMPVGEKLRLLRFGLWLRPRLREISGLLGEPVRSPALTDLDGVDADSYLSSRVGRRFVDDVVSPVLQSLGFAPASEWSALGALLLLSFSMTRRLHGVPTGNDLIARHMAADLEVRHGSAAVAVSPGPAGVEIELQSGGATDRLRCRDVVLAVPAPTAARLVEGALREVLGRFRYSSSVVPAVAVRTLDVRLPAVSFFGAADEDRRLSGVVAEQSAPGAPVVSYAAIRPPWQYELFDAPDEDIVAILTTLLDEVNGSPVDVVDARVIRWRDAVPVTDPHSLDRRREVANVVERIAHLEVAGDFMVSPSQEGALVSGLRAAETLLVA